MPSLLDKQDHRRNESLSEQSRELMKPQEVREMGDDKAILLVEGARPVYADKIRFFEDENFSNRLRVAPEVVPLDISQPEPEVIVGEIKTRPMNESELANPQDMAIANFSLDFSDVVVPGDSDNPPDDAEIEDAAAAFCERASNRS